MQSGTGTPGCDQEADESTSPPFPYRLSDLYSGLWPDEKCTAEEFIRHASGLLENGNGDNMLREVIGQPLPPGYLLIAVAHDTAVSLARQMYESRNFTAMPILADALQDAGCDNEDILAHCRGDGPHVRGCWVVDLVLGRE